MKKCGIMLCLSAAFAALCALWPAFAGWAAEYVSAPIAGALARLSAVASVSLAGVALLAAAMALKPRIIAALVIAVALFAAAWVPPMAREYANIPRASQAEIAALCTRLTAELNAQGRCVPEPARALAIARAAMNAPAAPRAAYLPGLMRRLRLAGIYIPITGEAVVDITRPTAGLAFTAAHELAHMRGIAHEGWANIAAYEACIAHGGAAAYSARLWALRYAVARLGDDWTRAAELAPVIYNDLARLPYAPGAAEEYAALADYLAAP